MSRTLSWGVIGTGLIAGVFANGVQQSQTGTLVAVGSRSQAAADHLVRPGVFHIAITITKKCWLTRACRQSIWLFLVVTIDPHTGNVTYSNDYDLIEQFSKFVAPGAYHIGADTLDSLTDVAYKNPDGSKVVVAYNDGFRSRTFKVRWNGSQSFIYTLSAVATLTFNWSGRHSTATSWIA
jgi:hypothetical protein